MGEVCKLETDFLKTMQRMYKDSRILYDKGEYYNCCYFCGYILECALKYILLKFGEDENGNQFTVENLKSNFVHKISKLNDQLNNCILETNSMPAKCRLDCNKNAPYIMKGMEGTQPWSPAYRYGEHPKWDKKEYCDHYIAESDYVFKFVAELT